MIIFIVLLRIHLVKLNRIASFMTRKTFLSNMNNKGLASCIKECHVFAKNVTTIKSSVL